MIPQSHGEREKKEDRALNEVDQWTEGGREQSEEAEKGKRRRESRTVDHR